MLERIGGFLNVYSLFFLLNCAVWTPLLYLSLRLKLWVKYPLVFVYIYLAMLFEIATNLSPWPPRDSLAYGYVFVARSLIIIALASAVLLKIYWILRPKDWRKDWHLIAVPAAIVVVGFSDEWRIWIFLRILNIAYAILTYLGLAALFRMRRSRNIDLGWNLTMVLLALTLPAVFYSLVLMSFTLQLNPSREAASLWMNGTAVAAWIILAVGMSEYSPPTQVPVKAGLEQGSVGDSGDDDMALKDREVRATSTQLLRTEVNISIPPLAEKSR